MRRVLVIVLGVFLVTVFATPRGADSAVSQKGKKPPKEETVVVAQLVLHDGFSGARLRSDTRLRSGADDDDDGFVDLGVPMSGPFDVLYQDRRIEIDGGPYPDPCSTFNVTTGGRGDGGIFADMDRGAGDAFNDCALFINPDGNQPYLDDPDTPTLDDDGRAVVLEFDKGEAGGECVCSELGGRLADPASLDAFMTEYFDLPRTGFIEDEDSCTLAIANGEILTDSTNNRTGNVRISALHPFREGSSKKGKKGSSGPPENASVSIGFHIDRLPGDLNGWRIDSVGFSTDNPRLEITHFDNDPDTKIITSSNEPFELVLAGAGNTNPICSGFTLPFEMTLRRFTVTQ